MRLPIHSSTNPMFDFFLGRGLLAYLAAVVLYGALVWFAVAVLPRRLALVAEFVVILGLCYSASNWIVVRWQTGTGGAVLFVAALAIALSAVMTPSSEYRDNSGLRRLCWIMAFAVAIDCIFTLLGQPASYWQNSATVFEANPASKYFLEQGWWAYAVYNLAEIGVPWFLVSRTQPATGWAIAFGMALGGFCGGSNWLFYVWRLGFLAPLVYATLLSIAIAWWVLKRNPHATPNVTPVSVSQGTRD